MAQLGFSLAWLGLAWLGLAWLELELGWAVTILFPWELQ